MIYYESIVLISEGGGENIEVLDLSRIYLGKWAQYIAKIFSIAVLLGATIAYWVLMANFLYNSVNFIYGKDSHCNHVCMILMNYSIMKYIRFADNIAGWPTRSASENISNIEGKCTKYSLIYYSRIINVFIQY